MRRRPLVGITTYERGSEERPRFHLPAAYVDAVRLAGGLPVLLPPGDESPDHALEGLDALLFSGGGDIHPDHFGGEAHADSYSMCPERDAFELELMQAALAAEMPTLAICRGLQVLNVARGGDLHAHLPEALGERVVHRASQDRHAHHEVRLDEDSHLARVYREAHLHIASWHHQGVRRLGEGLRATAWAEDGSVEALELADAPWLLAVQWHPELQLDRDSPQRSLLLALVRMAGERS